MNSWLYFQIELNLSVDSKVQNAHYYIVNYIVLHILAKVWKKSSKHLKGRLEEACLREGCERISVRSFVSRALKPVSHNLSLKPEANFGPPPVVLSHHLQPPLHHPPFLPSLLYLSSNWFFTLLDRQIGFNCPSYFVF